ncbi:uncharacterized protein TNCT_346681 [Trichonephila clavata]|uniref:Uncharacterized protein n=1 Tax=Trichonephila clavata TaxID=2740835 RepID=A0A8X6KK93_TRICU|nr:uncharacterized protein TNCT_346681 [Trichonephila clavata]
MPIRLAIKLADLDSRSTTYRVPEELEFVPVNQNDGSNALVQKIRLVSHVVSQSCEQSYYERCLKQLVEFADKGDLLFASSEEELRQECVQAQSSLGCLTRYAKKCLSLEERSKFTDGIAGPQKVTLGLCTDETDFRSRYIKNIPCLRNMSDGLRYCKEKYDRNQKDIILVEYEDKTHLQCCSFDGYRRCLRMLIETQDSCREETVDVVDELASRIGGIFSEETCADHFERCTGAASIGIQMAVSISHVFLTSLASILLLKYL